MKKIILIAIIALSFASCKFENTYRVVRIEHDGRDYVTTIKSDTNYSVYQTIVINGEHYMVTMVESVDLK